MKLAWSSSFLALATSMCAGFPQQRCTPNDPPPDAGTGGSGGSAGSAGSSASGGTAGSAGAAGNAGSGGSGTLTREQLMDPQTCRGCHAGHYDEWARSMHAYAGDDPVFNAMNKRGQRETNGQLGNFCVKCHAPMAVQTGATTDGLNLASLPQKMKGVTCYFCHSIDAIQADHEFNNPLHLADDGVMRAQISDPFPSPAHGAAYSALHDRDQLASAQACGVCHDIVNTQGAHIERTLKEWQGSVFSQAGVGTTCSQCHMDQSTDLRQVASLPGAPLRRTHNHSFPAVDVATRPFPDAAGTERLKADNQAFLNTTLQSALCVHGVPGASNNVNVIAILDNVAAGHGFPSGAAQDRRLWVEIQAYSAGELFYTSGVLPDSARPITDLVALDPDLWLLRDRMFDEQGREVHSFWEPACYETDQLPAQLTFSQLDPRFYQSHVYKQYPSAAGTGLVKYPDRVTMRVRLSPIGQDIIQDLIASGDLTDLSARDQATVYDLGVNPVLEWTPGAATESFRDNVGIPTTCISTTNLLGAANKVPARAQSSCDSPDAGTSMDDGGMPDAAVSCMNDPRVSTYAPNSERLGQAGNLKVRLVSAAPEPPAKGVNTWTIQVLTAAGATITGATVTMHKSGSSTDPYMPDHGHSSSVPVTVTANPDATFTVNPIYLFMAGVWRVGFDVKAPDGTSDTVYFYYCVEG